MHCIEEQLEQEGIRVEFQSLLQQAVFAGNSMINYGGATPYVACWGQQPHLLPNSVDPIGGVDAGGQLKVAAMTYRQGGSDFWTGPLNTTTATITPDECNEWDIV